MPRPKIPRPLRIAAATFALLLMAIAGILGVLSLDGVSTAVSRRVLKWVSPEGLVVEVGRVSRLGLGGLTATDIVVEDPNRGLTARLDTVRADIRLLSLRWGRVVVSELGLAGLALQVEADGLPPDEADPPSPAGSEGDPWSVVLEAVELRPGQGGSDQTSGFRIGGVSGSLRSLQLSPELGAESWSVELTFAPVGQAQGWGSVAARGSLSGLRLQLDTLSLRSPHSRVAGQLRLPLDSGWSRPGSVEWRLQAAPLALGDFEGLVPVPAVLAGDSLTLDSWSESEGDSAAVYLSAETSTGASLTTELRWGRRGSRIGVRGDARVADLDLRRYLGDAVPVGSTSGTAVLVGEADWQDGSVSTAESSFEAELTAPEGELRLGGRLARGRNDDAGVVDTLDVRLDQLRWGDAVRGAGELRATSSSGVVEWFADLRPGDGGRLAASGDLTNLDAQEGPRWTADVRLDAVAEPRSGSVITGRAQGAGTGPLPSVVTLALAPSEVAGWSLDTATVGWTQRQEGRAPATSLPDGRLQGSTEGGFGAVSFDAALSIQEDGGRLGLRSLSLDSLGWPGASGQEAEDDSASSWATTRLDGEVTGALAWEGPVSEAADPVRWTGDVAAVLRGIGLPGPQPFVDSIQAELHLESGLVDGRLQGGLPGAGRASLGVSGALAAPLNLRVTDGRFQRVDLSAFLASAPPTRLDGTVAGEVVGSADGALPEVRGRIELDPSTVRDGRIETLVIDLLLGPAEIRGDVLAELAGGTVRGRVDGPDGWQVGGLEETSWRLEADAELPELGAFFGLPDTAIAVAGRLEAQANPGSGARLEVGIWQASGWGGQIDTAVVRGVLTASVLTVDTLLVRSNLGVAEGGGAVPRVVLGLPPSLPPEPVLSAVSPSTLALRVSVPDSAAVLRLGPRTRVEVAGGEAVFEASCRQNECTLESEVDLETVLLGRWSVLSLQAGLDGSVGPGRSWGPTRTGILVEGIRTPRLDARNATFQTHWNGSDLEVVGTAEVDDRRSAAAELRIDPGDRSLAFQRLDLRFDEDEWGLERPVTFRSDSTGVSLDSLVFTAAPQRIVAGIGEAEGARYLSVTADSLRLDAFTDLLGRPGLGGSMSGQLRLRGAEERLVLLGELAAEVTEDGRPSHRIEIEAEARAGEFSGELAVRDATGVSRIVGRAGGQVPGVGEGRWEGSLELDDVPLEWTGVYAPPEWVRDATGSMQAQLSFAGGPGGIVANGPLTLRSGRAVIPRASIALEDIEVDAALEGRTLRLNSAGATSRGRLALEGTISVPADDGVPELDLRVTAADFLASNSRELELAVSGEVTAEGTLDVPRIGGRLQVGQASYRIPAVLGRQLREVTLTDEDWAILQSRFGIAPPAADDDQPWLPRSALLDLDVSLGRNIWLRRDANPELALQFTGDFRITKSSQEDELQLEGTIESIPGRSYVEEFARRFTLEEGQVTLRGPVDEARLEVTAQYAVPTSPDEDPVTIRLDVTGGLDELELALSSQPSLSNGDIVSYLATGRPASTAFSGDGSAGLGADILASRLSGSLEQLAQEEVGLDVLQIQQEGLHGTSLVAGKYVNPRLFLGFRQGVTFQADDGRSFSEGLTSQAEVEYAALNWLVVNIQGGTSAIRFFLEGTYGW